MAAPTSAQTFLPGRLIKAPASFTVPGADGNYGGTRLGNAQSFAVEPRLKEDVITAEEYGSEPYESILLGYEVTAACAFVAWDADAVTTVFHSVAAGVVSIPGSQRSGSLLSTKAVALLYVPHDTDSGPAIYLPQAIPLWEPTVLHWSGYRELRLACVFRATRTSGGVVAKIGPVASL